MQCVEDRPDTRLVAWAADHHGLFRSEDARRLGLNQRQVRYRVDTGRAIQVGTGVYRVAGSAQTSDQQLLAAAWRCAGWISHRSGLVLLELLAPRAGRVHTSVRSDAAHEFGGLVVHRTGDLLDEDVTTVRGIPVTTPTRTLVDAGLTVTALELEKAVHRAVHRGLTTFAQLSATYTRVSAHGRNGAGPIGELLRAMDPTMAPAESDLEVALLSLLRRSGVAEPVRQHPVTVEGHDFRLDLAYPEHRLFLEGDGFGVHGSRTPFEEDRWRQNLLVVHGWWPLRFTWRQIHQQPEWCVETVRRKLELT